MGIISNKTERSELIAGDHIYTYRAGYTYAHHGIYVGGNTVVHFTSDANANNSSYSSSFASSRILSPTCAAYEDCGFRQSESGVVISCLDCFLQKRALYRFDYGVSKVVFCAKVRGGSCTIAMSDEPDTVIQRANYLLHNGFGNYSLFENNCEDFALYCKTGLLIVGPTRSGQVSSAFCAAPAVGLVALPQKFLIPRPSLATLSAVMYCYFRYANDIGVREDVVKVRVEDLGVMQANK